MKRSFKFKPSIGFLVTALVLGCAGDGPDGATPDPTEQDLPLRDSQQPTTDAVQQAGSDYQRPALDPQRVTPLDEQTLPGVSAELAIGDVSHSEICAELCAVADRAGCAGTCYQDCEEWEDAPAACLQLLRRFADCVGRAQGSCEAAVEGCSSELAEAANVCDLEVEEED